jgi:hypothetical protein
VKQRREVHCLTVYDAFGTFEGSGFGGCRLTVQKE